MTQSIFCNHLTNSNYICKLLAVLLTSVLMISCVEDDNSTICDKELIYEHH